MSGYDAGRINNNKFVIDPKIARKQPQAAGDLQSIYAEIDALTQQKTAKMTEIGAIKTEIAPEDTNISEDVANLTAALTEAQSSYSNAVADVSTASANATSASAEAASLQSQASAAMSNAQSLQSKASGMPDNDAKNAALAAAEQARAKAEALQQQAEEAQARADEAQAQLQTAQEAMQAAQDVVEEAQAALAQIQVEDDDPNQDSQEEVEIQALQEEIAGFDEKIAKLNAQIADLKNYDLSGVQVDDSEPASSYQDENGNDVVEASLKDGGKIETTKTAYGTTIQKVTKPDGSVVQVVKQDGSLVEIQTYTSAEKAEKIGADKKAQEAKKAEEAEKAEEAKAADEAEAIDEAQQTAEAENGEQCEGGEKDPMTITIDGRSFVLMDYDGKDGVTENDFFGYDDGIDAFDVLDGLYTNKKDDNISLKELKAANSHGHNIMFLEVDSSTGEPLEGTEALTVDRFTEELGISDLRLVGVAQEGLQDSSNEDRDKDKKFKIEYKKVGNDETRTISNGLVRSFEEESYFVPFRDLSDPTSERADGSETAADQTTLIQDAAFITGSNGDGQAEAVDEVEAEETEADEVEAEAADEAETEETEAEETEAEETEAEEAEATDSDETAETEQDGETTETTKQAYDRTSADRAAIADTTQYDLGEYYTGFDGSSHVLDIDQYYDKHHTQGSTFANDTEYVKNVRAGLLSDLYTYAYGTDLGTQTEGSVQGKEAYYDGDGNPVPSKVDDGLTYIVDLPYTKQELKDTARLCIALAEKNDLSITGDDDASAFYKSRLTQETRNQIKEILEQGADMTDDDIVALSQYVDAVSYAVAQRSWDGKLENDYLDLSGIAPAASTDTAATDETTDAAGTAEDSTADTSADTSASMAPDDLPQSPDDYYGINEGILQSGQYTNFSILGLTGLTCSKTDYDEFMNPDESSAILKLTDADGNEVTVQRKNGKYTATRTFQDEDGTEVTVETFYDKANNIFVEKYYNDKKKSTRIWKKEVTYNDDGSAKSWKNTIYYPDDSGRHKVMSNEGNYIQVGDGKYTDIYGKYEYTSQDLAIRASEIIDEYDSLGIANTTPSMELVLKAKNIPLLDDALENIKSGTDVTPPSKEEVEKMFQPDSIDPSVYEAMEYYDAIKASGIRDQLVQNGSGDELVRFEDYLKKGFSFGSEVGDPTGFKGVLKQICDQNGITIDSENNPEGYTPGIQYTYTDNSNPSITITKNENTYSYEVTEKTDIQNQFEYFPEFYPLFSQYDKDKKDKITSQLLSGHDYEFTNGNTKYVLKYENDVVKLEKKEDEDDDADEADASEGTTEEETVEEV